MSEYKTENEYKQGFATTKQWHEKSYVPIVTQQMSQAEILELRDVYAVSNKCEPKDILYTFQKITNKDDDDRDVCLLLTYHHRFLNRKNDIVKREIFSIKVPVPEYLQQQADNAKRQNMNTRKNTNLLTNAESEPSTTQSRPTMSFNDILNIAKQMPALGTQDSVQSSPQSTQGSPQSTQGSPQSTQNEPLTMSESLPTMNTQPSTSLLPILPTVSVIPTQTTQKSTIKPVIRKRLTKK
jgi:hypothetical protein